MGISSVLRSPVHANTSEAERCRLERNKTGSLRPHSVDGACQLRETERFESKHNKTSNPRLSNNALLEPRQDFGKAGKRDCGNAEKQEHGNAEKRERGNPGIQECGNAERRASTPFRGKANPLNNPGILLTLSGKAALGKTWVSQYEERDCNYKNG